MNYFLSKAFEDLNSLNEDIFKLDKKGIEDLKKFDVERDVGEDDKIFIIDDTADTSADLKDDYIGKLILKCETCDSLKYEDLYKVTIDDNSPVCNKEDQCPYCHCSNGYTIIGQVQEFNPNYNHSSNEDEEEELNKLKSITDVREGLTESINIFSDEAIKPLSKRIKSEILTNNGISRVPENSTEPMDNSESDEVDMDIEFNEFAEDDFDTLAEKYFKNVYKNVTTYSTSKVKENGNGLVLEGLITFNSGKTKKTSFILEAKDVSKRGIVRFSASNKEITGNNKSYIISGKVNNGNFITESLNYNYRIKTESGIQKIYGTVRK